MFKVMTWSMRRLSVMAVVIVLVSYPSVFAQHKDFLPVKDLEKFRQDFARESAKVQSITSDFRQEKQLLALTETITSTGKFWFRRSNQVRIDYQKPFIYQMIMNGDRILVKDEQKENRVNVKSNKMFQQVNRIMLNCIQGTILESKDFTNRVFEDEKYFLLEMTPAGKGLKDFFSTINLKVDKKDYSVESIEMTEPSGDNTILIFSNKVLNKVLSDEIFRL